MCARIWAVDRGTGASQRPGSLPAPRVACHYSPVGFDQQQPCRTLNISRCGRAGQRSSQTTRSSSQTLRSSSTLCRTTTIGRSPQLCLPTARRIDNTTAITATSSKFGNSIHHTRQKYVKNKGNSVHLSRQSFFLISYAQLNAVYLGNNVLRTMQINAYIWVFLLIFMYATQYTYISRQ